MINLVECNKERDKWTKKKREENSSKPEQSKIHLYSIFAVHQKIGRLQISMDDGGFELMKVIHSLGLS